MGEWVLVICMAVAGGPCKEQEVASFRMTFLSDPQPSCARYLKENVRVGTGVVYAMCKPKRPSAGSEA